MSNLLILTRVDPSTHQIAAHFRVSKVLIRRFPCQHLVQNDAHAPHIALRTVDILAVALGAHVGRRSHVVKQLRLLGLVQELAESEVSDACACTGEEDVGSLEVSVHYQFLFNGQVPISHVSDDMQRL